MDKLQEALDKVLAHPILAIIGTLVFGGITLSGRFSVTATRVCFFLAWLSAAYGLTTYRTLRQKPLFLICAILLAGVLFFILGAWIKPEAVPQNFGVLTPRRKLLFSSTNTVLRPMMEIGDSGTVFIWNGPDGKPMINFGDSTLTIEKIGAKVKVSTALSDQNGNLVAEIYQNEWKTHPIAWDRNYTDDALEVRDGRGKIILQVKALGDRIQMQGEWWSRGGYGTRLVSEGQRKGASIMFFTPQGAPPEDIPIRPMFVYPSELHFGELTQQR